AVIAYPQALAVVTTGRGLQHDGPAVAVALAVALAVAGKSIHLGHAPDPAVARAPDPQLPQRIQPANPVSHRTLVLGETQRGSGRADRRHLVKPGQDRGRHVLMVERDDVATRPERQHVGGGTAVADP